MFTKQELDEMEELAEELIFNAKCRVYEQEAGSPEIDPDTLQPISAPADLKYDGPCKVEPTSRNYERAFDFGEIRQASRTYNVRVRKSFTNPQINDRISVYESHDPAFDEGYELIIIDPQVSSTATQRVMVAELTLGH